MFYRLIDSLLLACGWSILFPALIQAQSPSQPNGALGDAFRSMFNPGSGVQRMGNIQRTNYFDDLLEARGRLEVAFVIDGTESMGAELIGVQQQLGQLISDLRRVVGKNLAVQMVVYRDVGAASGAVSWPLSVSKTSWAMDDREVAAGLAKLAPESGAPYYYEQVDAGLHAALTELNWSTETDVTRWIFLIGDAPPFKPGFAEEQNQAVRKYDTELLKRLAQDKDVRIYGIICPSRSEDRELHEKVLPECREFFQELADASHGAVLDLADSSQLEQVHHAAQLAATRGAKFAPITQAELDRFKTVAKKPDDRVIVAVLPFLTTSAMDFDFSNPMTQLAEEVRSQLDQKGIPTKRMAKVRDEYFQLIRSRTPLDDNVIAQKLADRLKVDYLIWKHQPANNNTLQVAVINARTGKADAVSDPIDPQKSSDSSSPLNVRLCSQVIQSLATKTKSNSPTIAKVFDGKFQTRLVSTSEAGSRQLESARLYLQGSMKKSANSGDADDLRKAIEALQAAPESMRADPLWNNLMANAYYGLGLQARLQDKKSAVDSFRNAQKFADASTKGSLEFQADYNFFHKRYEKAIQAYEEVVKQETSVDSVCRARWMLVFLYAGDWDVEPGQVNLQKSREHAISLLATYPDSAEAVALKDALHWEERQQRTRLNELVLEDPSPSDR